jgi:hypothetical protein
MGLGAVLVRHGRVPRGFRGPVVDSPRPFDPDRYSPIKPDVILRLPEGNARTFWIASTLGRFLRLDGSSERLQSGKEAAGTLVTPNRRAVILATLDLGVRQWQRLTKDWERRGLAHRCGRGTAFLFAHSHLGECPACHREILVDSDLLTAPSPRRNRGGFGKRHDASRQSDMMRRLTRTTTSHEGALERRVSGTNELHPSNRSLPRDEVGLEDPQGSSDLQGSSEWSWEDRRDRVRSRTRLGDGCLACRLPGLRTRADAPCTVHRDPRRAAGADPNTEPTYERLFQVLIDVDQDLRMLKGRMRGRRADA